MQDNLWQNWNLCPFKGNGKVTKTQKVNISIFFSSNMKEETPFSYEGFFSQNELALILDHPWLNNIGLCSGCVLVGSDLYTLLISNTMIHIWLPKHQLNTLSMEVSDKMRLESASSGLVVNKILLALLARKDFLFF